MAWSLVASDGTATNSGVIRPPAVSAAYAASSRISAASSGFIRMRISSAVESGSSSRTSAASSGSISSSSSAASGCVRVRRIRAASAGGSSSRRAGISSSGSHWSRTATSRGSSWGTRSAHSGGPMRSARPRTPSSSRSRISACTSASSSRVSTELIGSPPLRRERRRTWNDHRVARNVSASAPGGRRSPGRRDGTLGAHLGTGRPPARGISGTATSVHWVDWASSTKVGADSNRRPLRREGAARYCSPDAALGGAPPSPGCRRSACRTSDGARWGSGR